jgi:hypothetical protein
LVITCPSSRIIGSAIKVKIHNVDGLVILSFTLKAYASLICVAETKRPVRAVSEDI